MHHIFHRTVREVLSLGVKGVVYPSIPFVLVTHATLKTGTNEVIASIIEIHCTLAQPIIITNNNEYYSRSRKD